MKQDNMHLINKIFNNETIRTIWDKDEEKYYISIVDIVGVLADSKEPRKYWERLHNKWVDFYVKNRLVLISNNSYVKRINMLKLINTNEIK